MGRRRVSRMILGVILSAYGLYRLTQIPGALGSVWHLSGPRILRVVAWWPRLPAWVEVGGGRGLTYLGWLCMVALAAGGVGVVWGHRPAMRMTLIALAVLIGLGVIALPGDVALVCGWITVDYTNTNLATDIQASPKSPDALPQVPSELWRLGAMLALLSGIVSLIVKIGVLLWARWELSRDATNAKAAA